MTVLLADEILKLCDDTHSPPMIQPFDPSQLRPASYQLTLGGEVHVGGVPQRIEDYPKGFVLQPHQVAVVSTFERLCIPRSLIARWSLRVTNIYEGLLWTGGPQVDPGWEGSLFCPIYNLAERPVVLKYKDPLFTIDFTRTTPVTDEIRRLKKTHEFKSVWFAPQRRTLSQHDSHRLHSAPYETLRQLTELHHFRNLGYTAITLMLLVLTVLVGVVAVTAVKEPVKLDGFGPWYLAALGGVAFLSLLSLAASILTIWKFRRYP